MLWFVSFVSHFDTCEKWMKRSTRKSTKAFSSFERYEMLQMVRKSHQIMLNVCNYIIPRFRNIVRWLFLLYVSKTLLQNFFQNRFFQQ